MTLLTELLRLWSSVELVPVVAAVGGVFIAATSVFDFFVHPLWSLHGTMEV